MMTEVLFLDHDYSYTPELRALGSRIADAHSNICQVWKWHSLPFLPSWFIGKWPKLVSRKLYSVGDIPCIHWIMILGKRGDFCKKSHNLSPPHQKKLDSGTLLFFAKETWTISLESAAFLGFSHWTEPSLVSIGFPVCDGFFPFPCLQFGES